MSKKILFISPKENLGHHPEPYPSGVFILLGTMAHNLGHQVKIIHRGGNKVDIERVLTDFQPDIVGISINTFQTKDAKQITKLVKEKNVLIVAGGPHVSGMGSRIFNDFPDIDIAVFGEGEHTFLEILAGKDFSQIRGMAYKEKGEVRVNASRSPAKNLDYLPLPNLDLVDFTAERFKGVDPILASPAMYIMASRGCPFQCVYCNKSIWGFSTRFRKPEAIIRELEWLRDRYGIKEIFFQDDTLNLNRAWVTKLLNLIIEKGLNKDMMYKVALRANKSLIDRELLELLKEANVKYIFYGVESGNQEMLDRMKKGLTIEELKRAFALTREVGIKTIASFIIGLPGETKQTIQDTLNLWRELNSDMAGYSLATPLPGTEFEKMLMAKGHLLDRNYDHYSFGTGVVRTDDMTKEELEQYRLKVATEMEIKELKNKVKNFKKREIKELLVKVIKNPRKAIKRIIIWQKH